MSKIDNYLWTKFRMPNVYTSAAKISKKSDKSLLISLPLTWETLCLIDSIREKFSKIIVIPLTSGENGSLQSGVFKYLKEWNIIYFTETSDENRVRALKLKPDVIIDCVFTLSKFGFENNLIPPNTLVIEDTRTGGEKLRNYLKDNKFPNQFYILDDHSIKRDYENKLGIGYSVVGNLISNGILLIGKSVLVVGFGPVGQGIARFCKGMGAKVFISEINPKLLEKASKNYLTGNIEENVKKADIIITATGKCEVIGEDLLLTTKDGVILANAGADFGEWDHEYLESTSSDTKKLYDNLNSYTLKNNKRVLEMGGGNSINLVAGVSVSEFLDLTFSLAILVIKQYLEKGSEKQELSVEHKYIEDLLENSRNYSNI